MRLAQGLHLAYSTNVHRGETWAETFQALNQHTLRVKETVCPNAPYGIGLRLSDVASRQLQDRKTLGDFQNWLDHHQCYVFTINGFPFGQFHGTRVKEQVYQPDWTTEERVAYTNRLFDLLSVLLPDGMEGSVSTSPGSFKEFVTTPAQEKRMRDNLWRSVEHIARLSETCGRELHLGLEPEPLGYLENTRETLAFFEQMHDAHPADPRLTRHLGVNYDTCHFAVEFEQASRSLGQLCDAGIRLSKLHLSNALRLTPSQEALAALEPFAEDTYLHQVITRHGDGSLQRFRDLSDAFNPQSAIRNAQSVEARVHFHIPLHSSPAGPLADTRNHLLETLDFLSTHPGICRHVEMETYTWEVLPADLRAGSIEEQLTAEYRWTLAELEQRGRGRLSSS
jgi:hypothetical protein